MTSTRVHGAEGKDAGYAAVDALVGLTILSSVVTLSIVGLSTALRLSASAGEIDRARTELVTLAETTPMYVGERSGETGEFHWSSHVSAPEAAGSLCRLRLRLQTRAGLSHELVTARPCAVATA